MKTTDLKESKLLAEALAAAGYGNYKPFFTKTDDNAIHFNIGHKIDSISQHEKKYGNENSIRPAFTMCELWDMLPKWIKYDHNGHQMDAQLIIGVGSKKSKDKNDLHNMYLGFNGFQDCVVASEKAENPCNALARLCIWCIENGHELNLKKIES